MIEKALKGTDFNMLHQVALILLSTMLNVAASSDSNGEVALVNVTRFASGDLFSLIGTDCGPTRCMEISHGTALSAMGSEGCVCQCRKDTPTFREDQRVCVNHIEDVVDAICAVTSAQYLSPSGWVTLRDLVDNDVPFSLYRDEGSTFLQWRGSSNLHSRLEGRLVAAHVLCSSPEQSRLAASCAAFRVAGASQNSLLDVKSIPFHAGEVVTSEPANQSQGLSVLELLAICVCVLMLIFIYAAGIIFYVHYKQRQKKQEKDPEINLSNSISADNISTLDSRIDIENVQLKTNPLLGMNNLTNEFINDAGLSDVSEHTEDTVDSSSNIIHRKSSYNITSAVIHTRRKKPIQPGTRATSTPERINERLQRRSASPDTFERAPHSDLSIIDCSMENNIVARQPLQSSNGETTLRKKLYFNPVFFETEHLKNPPPAAIEFLIKIREVMSIAKEKMVSKRFIPILSDISEEELYHTIDLGWDIPCARRGRRFSAISLKQENTRRTGHCGGCPGCDSNNSNSLKSIALMRSNSCKTCVSDDYKQRIVRKWLDEVPTPQSTEKPVKSIAKVSGTPRVIDSKPKNDVLVRPSDLLQTGEPKMDTKIPKDNVDDRYTREYIINENNPLSITSTEVEMNVETTQTIIIPEHKTPTNHKSRRIRRKLPPPPPPPVCEPKPQNEEDVEPILPEVKVKMEAVIRELNKCRRVESKEVKELKLENIPNAPKIVIPVLAADSQYYSDDNILTNKCKKEFYIHRDDSDNFDSLERNSLRRRRFSLACEPELSQKEEFRLQSNILSTKERFSRSWRDIKKAVDGHQLVPQLLDLNFENKSEIFINAMDPLYDNVCKTGPLTIKVSGSPIESRRNQNEEFDPDTLDRKPKRETKRVEKILLKSGGSFKCKAPEHDNEPNKTPPEAAFTRKIGSLRQIYEAKAKNQDSDSESYGRRNSIPFINPEITGFSRSLKTPDLIRQIESQKEKPPIPPKQRRGSESSPKFSTSTRDSPPGDRHRMSEERDRFSQTSRMDNINTRRSVRRSARTRSRRTDLRKLYKTEDSGYMSTDSNESKRRARYLMQLRPKTIVPEPTKIMNKLPNLQIESDTDDLESLCDGRSESGGESVETDSVFFGNFDDTKDLLAELGLSSFEIKSKGATQEQIDSGFMGETNIILSGDSDSEHRSVISIKAGCDSKVSAPLTKLDDPPYVRSVEC
ncbi:unnamed protein product [Diatraea saccharalis]|uniref:Shavenoid isoform B-like N-terminal domain-containing protein n=1 Tax=Diatraea saccharalis TaxID=40085 RepID=A0A9N9RF83_9NEOP|nr:unnamed protein product [Diatraea saccharalis]